MMHRYYSLEDISTYRTATRWKVCSSGFFARLTLADLLPNVLHFASIPTPGIRAFVKTISEDGTKFIGGNLLQLAINAHIYKIQALTFNPNLDSMSCEVLLRMLWTSLNLHRSGEAILYPPDFSALQSAIVELTANPNLLGDDLFSMSNHRFPENNFGQNPAIRKIHIENWFNTFIRTPIANRQLLDNAALEEFFTRFNSVSDNMRATYLQEILNDRKWDFMARYRLFNVVAANIDSTETELRLIITAFDQQITHDAFDWSEWNDTKATGFLSSLEHHPIQLDGAWKVLRNRLYEVTKSECYLNPEAASLFCF